MSNFNENYTLFQIDSDRPDRTDVCDLVFVAVECWYKWDENIRSHLLLPGTHLNRFWRFSGAHWWSFYFSTPGGSFQSGGQTNNDLKGVQKQREKMKKCSHLSKYIGQWPPLETAPTMTTADHRVSWWRDRFIVGFIVFKILYWEIMKS